MHDKNNKSLNPKENKQDHVDPANFLHKLSKEEKKIVFDLLENDPLGNYYKKCLTVFLLIAITLLLWPLHCNFSTPKNGAGWIKASNGINFLTPGKIISGAPAKPLYNQMTAGSGFSLEAWVSSGDTGQRGPARIVSYSLDSSNRNFTLGQSGKKLDMRLRTSITDNNGVYPHIVVDNVFNSSTPQYITITYDFSMQPVQRIYVNGEIRAEQNIHGGNFSNWDPDHYLVLGNEVTGKRPWAGSLFYVSLYNRALQPDEVRQNYITVTAGQQNSPKKGALVSSGLVARYFFTEGKGNIIKDSSGRGQPLNLHRPKKLNQQKNHFLTTSSSKLTQFSDIILNILIFIPFGFLLSGVVKKRYRSQVTTFFIVVSAGCLFTLSIESIQYFIGRTSSLIDVLNNIIGTAAGVVLFSSWKKLLVAQSRQLRESHLFVPASPHKK